MQLLENPEQTLVQVLQRSREIEETKRDESEEVGEEAWSQAGDILRRFGTKKGINPVTTVRERKDISVSVGRESILISMTGILAPKKEGQFHEEFQKIRIWREGQKWQFDLYTLEASGQLKVVRDEVNNSTLILSPELAPLKLLLSKINDALIAA